LLQGKDLKKFKDHLKEEEKAALKRISKSQRKEAVNRTKLELQSKRAEKVVFSSTLTSQAPPSFSLLPFSSFNPFHQLYPLFLLHPLSSFIRHLPSSRK
jgi:hypothetical protein